MIHPKYYNGILIGTSCVPILLHIVGLVLLQRTRCAYSNKSQWVLLLNLSFAELLFVSFGFTTAMLDMISMETLSFQVLVFHYIGVTLAYFFVIIFITIERFMEVYLNIKYPVYWTVVGTRNVLSVMWFLCITFSLAALLYPDFHEESLNRVCYLFLFPAVELMFLVIGLFVYGYVLVKLHSNSSRQIPYTISNSNSSGRNNRNDISLAHSEREQRKKLKAFIMPSLFVLTFILFAIVPDQLYFYALLTGVKLPESIMLLVPLFYNFAMSSDALVYVLMSPPLRKFVKQKLEKLHIRKLNLKNRKQDQG